MSDSNLTIAHNQSEGCTFSWRDAQPPLWPPAQDGSHRKTGRLRSCEYCGSMHPADVAEFIRKGASGSWADFKYGWPHKAYFDNIPNPFVGLIESRCSRSNPPKEEIEAGLWIKLKETQWNTTYYHELGSPAPQHTYGKFYSIHLLDASIEDKAVIEQHLGLEFTFGDGNKTVSWKRITRSGVAKNEC